MIIPWDLVGTAAVSVVLAVWWAGRRAHALDTAESPVDPAIAVGVTALLAGRLVTLGLDVALSGWSALDPRAALTLGAGISTPGALLGAVLAGAVLTARGRMSDRLWRAAVPAAAAGLALWSVLSLVRGDAAGIAMPLGLAGGARVPVGPVEGVVYATLAWLVVAGERGRGGLAARVASLGGARTGALLGAIVAGTHLLGGVLRPAVPTVDGDLDVLLGLIVFALLIVLVAGVRPRVVVELATAAAILLGGFSAAFAFAAEPPALPAPASSAELSGALLGDGSGGPLPAWAGAELRRFVEDAGHPVVVNVWASWCPPCRAEAPALARVANGMAGRVSFLGLNVDDRQDAARAFAARYRLPFPTVGDGGLRRELGVAGLPTTIVLRADGSVAERIVGGIDARSLAAAIDRAS